MPRKKTNKKKKTKNLVCIDCEGKTSNFYRIQTNRGDVIKCHKCYELWILRTGRTNANDFGHITQSGGREAVQ